MSSGGASSGSEIFPAQNENGENQLRSSGSEFSQPKSTAEKTQLRSSKKSASSARPTPTNPSLPSVTPAPNAPYYETPTRALKLTEKTPARVFQMSDLFLSGKSPLMKYTRRTTESKSSVKWGQRKLLLSEIEFFTLHWDSQKVPNPICVYAGAAPGTHIMVLSKLFPAFTFHLYDLRDFDLPQTEKLNLHKEYFTDEVAAQWAGRDDVYFISDIRNGGVEESRQVARLRLGKDASEEEVRKMSSVLMEEDVIADMKNQERWLRIINPVEGQLKLHLPYVIGENVGKTFSYIHGIIYLQVWEGKTSTETRLVPLRGPDGKFMTRQWNPLWYEQALFYHNKVTREKVTFLNPFTQDTSPIDEPELLNDYDSAGEAFILSLYLQRVKPGTTIEEKQIKSFSRYLTANLVSPLKPTPEKSRKSLAKIREEDRLVYRELEERGEEEIKKLGGVDRNAMLAVLRQKGVNVNASGAPRSLPPVGNLLFEKTPAELSSCPKIKIPRPQLGTLEGPLLPTPDEAEAGFVPWPKLKLVPIPRPRPEIPGLDLDLPLTSSSSWFLLFDPAEVKTPPLFYLPRRGEVSKAPSAQEEAAAEALQKRRQKRGLSAAKKELEKQEEVEIFAEAPPPAQPVVGLNELPERDSVIPAQDQVLEPDAEKRLKSPVSPAEKKKDKAQISEAQLLQTESLFQAYIEDGKDKSLTIPMIRSYLEAKGGKAPPGTKLKADWVKAGVDFYKSSKGLE